MRRLTLVEFEPYRGVPLTPAECDALQTTLPGLVVTPTRRTPGAYDLTPGSWVGVVQLPSLAVEVLPKLPIGNVLFLVAIALGADASGWADLWHESPAYLAPSSGLIEAIALLFARQSQRALRRGLLQGYRVEEATLPTVRGRIRFEQHLRQGTGHPLPVPVRYQEHGEDLLENQLLKAAALMLRAHLARSREAPNTGGAAGGAHVTGGTAGTAASAHFPPASPSSQLVWVLATLERVSEVRFAPAEVPPVTYTPLNAHYRLAVGLARLILRATALQPRHGALPGASLLLDMNRLFEDFVVAALRRTLGLHERTLVQGMQGRADRTLFLDAARQVPLRPDLSWWEGDRCVFVADMKYKRSAQGMAADLYQLLAYTAAAGLAGGLLIYAAGQDDPANDETGSLISHVVEQAGKTLHVASLNLAGPPSTLLSQIEQLAHHARSLRRAATEARHVVV